LNIQISQGNAATHSNRDVFHFAWFVFLLRCYKSKTRYRAGRS